MTPPAPPRRSAEAASAPPSAPDWAGVAHPRATGAARIACLVPSLTELLFALGLGAHVVARTGFCVHPRAVRAVPKIGGTKDPDLDRLRALAPTHLVVNVDENRREDVDAARAFVPHVIVTHPQTPVDNARLFALFGAIFDRAAEAAALTRDLQAAIAVARATADALPREPVLYLIWRKPWMTVARDTYVAATLALVGWDTLPVAAARRYPDIADDAPEWDLASRLLLSTEPYAFRPRDVAALAAERGKPVELVDGEYAAWYGSRASAGLRGLAALRRALTP